MCEACPLGRVALDAGFHEECQGCPKGEKCPDPAEPGVACEFGSYCSADMATRAAATECPEGSYCVDVAADPEPCFPDQSVCLAANVCAEGYAEEMCRVCAESPSR